MIIPTHFLFLKLHNCLVIINLTERGRYFSLIASLHGTSDHVFLKLAWLQLNKIKKKKLDTICQKSYKRNSMT